MASALNAAPSPPVARLSPRGIIQPLPPPPPAPSAPRGGRRYGYTSVWKKRITFRDPPPWWTPEALAATLGVDVATVWRWIRKGEVDATRDGLRPNQLCIPHAALVAFLERQQCVVQTIWSNGTPQEATDDAP